MSVYCISYLAEVGHINSYLNSGSVWRAAATDSGNQTNPVWGPSSELLRNVTKLSFAYYDESGTPIDTTTLSGRLAISRIDTLIEVRPSGAGPAVPAFTLQTPGYLRLPRTP